MMYQECPGARVHGGRPRQSRLTSPGPHHAARAPHRPRVDFSDLSGAVCGPCDLVVSDAGPGRRGPDCGRGVARRSPRGGNRVRAGNGVPRGCSSGNPSRLPIASALREFSAGGLHDEDDVPSATPHLPHRRNRHRIRPHRFRRRGRRLQPPGSELRPDGRWSGGCVRRGSPDRCAMRRVPELHGCDTRAGRARLRQSGESSHRPCWR